MRAYDAASGLAREGELIELISKINTDALEARASRLRQGIRCSIPPLGYGRDSMMGGMNYHFDVRFDDGVTWIARVRRFNATSPPAALRDYTIQSEVATLSFLRQTKVPAPEVYDFDLEHPDNAVGVGFILMEKLPGKSLDWGAATREQRGKVMEQLADIFIELHKYPFPLIGSLNGSDAIHVSALARESLSNFEQNEMKTIGPFSSWEEYNASSIQLILDMIVQEEMHSWPAVDAYLIHRFLLDLVPKVFNSTQKSDAFYLKHADDKGTHILVDENFEITGIIDWEWAHTAPPSHAFKSPIGFLPVREFYEGKTRLGEDEIVFACFFEARGRTDLADCVREGRLQHLFAFCCGFDFVDWDGFLGLFRGLRIAVAVDQGLEWDAWKSVALERYKDDSGLQQILARH